MTAACTVSGLDGHRDEQGPQARFSPGELGR